jgi:hypothetical protein
MSLSERKKAARMALRHMGDVGVTPRQIAESWTTHPKGQRPSNAEFEELCAETELRLKNFCDGSGDLFEMEVRRLARIEQCLPALLSIRRSLLEFTRLGTNDTAVAEHVNLDPARISKLRRHIFLVDQSTEKIGDIAKVLCVKVTEWKSKTLKLILQSASAQVEVLDFCHEQDTIVDDKLRGSAIGSLALGLVDPKGTRGFLARVGGCMYIAFAEKDDKRAMAHELRHLAARLEEEASEQDSASSEDRGLPGEQFQ